MIDPIHYESISLQHMEIGILEIMAIAGIAIAIGGTVYANKHERKFKSERMMITYVGIALSGIAFTLPFLQ